MPSLQNLTLGAPAVSAVRQLQALQPSRLARIGQAAQGYERGVARLPGLSALPPSIAQRAAYVVPGAVLGGAAGALTASGDPKDGKPGMSTSIGLGALSGGLAGLGASALANKATGAAAAHNVERRGLINDVQRASRPPTAPTLAGAPMAAGAMPAMETPLAAGLQMGGGLPTRGKLAMVEHADYLKLAEQAMNGALAPQPPVVARAAMASAAPMAPAAAETGKTAADYWKVADVMGDIGTAATNWAPIGAGLGAIGGYLFGSDKKPAWKNMLTGAAGGALGGTALGYVGGQIPGAIAKGVAGIGEGVGAGAGGLVNGVANGVGSFGRSIYHNFVD